MIVMQCKINNKSSIIPLYTVKNNLSSEIIQRLQDATNKALRMTHKTRVCKLGIDYYGNSTFDLKCRVTIVKNQVCEYTCFSRFSFGSCRVV
jgi:hypothetical protein